MDSSKWFRHGLGRTSEGKVASRTMELSIESAVVSSNLASTAQ